MKKRFLQVLTAVAFMLLIFSFSAFAGDGITDAAEKRYDAAVAYLNEFYIKKNPEAALTVYQGSYKDKQTLKNAAKKKTRLVFQVNSPEKWFLLQGIIEVPENPNSFWIRYDGTTPLDIDDFQLKAISATAKK